MALDLTPQGIVSEIEKAKEHRDAHLGSPYYEQIERFVGPGYSRRTATGRTDYNNHSYKILSTFLPLIASGNPRVKTKTPRQGSAAALAKAVEFGVNRNFELQNLKRTIEELATDWFFKWSVAFTQPRPTAGLFERENPNYRPVTVRMSLTDYVVDPVAIKHAEARYQGHRLFRDKDSILREAEEHPGRGWDKAVIAKLGTKPDRENRGERLQDTYDRDEVEYWEFWVPEAQLDSAKDEAGRTYQPLRERGFNGTVYTVAKDCDKFLRPPRPLWGPRDGPYTYGGYLYVPDRTVPLSMIAATAAQAEVVGMIWEAIIAAARRYKKGVAVSTSAAADLGEKLAEFEDQGILTVDALDDVTRAIQQIEVGGITQQHLTLLSTLTLNLEQVSGLTEAAQGQVSGQGTATEASIAQMASGRRMGYAAEKFTTGVVKSIAEKEAWYAVMHPLSRIPLGEQANGIFVDPSTGEPIEMPVLVGGQQHSELLEDMDIEIEPISMRYTTELLEAERSAQQDAWLGSFGPMIPQMPWINWELLLSRKAELWGDPSLAKLVNMSKANIIGALQFQMNLSGVPQNPPVPQPRLGMDTQPALQLKASETPAGFSRNARGQQNKGPRVAGATSETHQTPSKEVKKT